ncbi:hypothetical protein Leryth_003024 [Lithospermum erythrorhizon]|nr:hypothetical protein Leryth_003024 [Lithospermum erythrorhizon]
MGIYLSTPKTKKDSDDGENDRLRYGVSSMQGWRSSMEDAHAAYPDQDCSLSFFGVYDGHGGKAVARYCAKYLHQELVKQEAYLAGDLPAAARKAFLRMDEIMCGQSGRKELAELGGKEEQSSDMIEDLIFTSNRGEADPGSDDYPYDQGCQSNGPSSGCTACVAIIHHNQLIVANAGDSRCVLSRKGQAYPMSEDHKPDQEIERERIHEAGGYVQCGRVNGSLNLSRAIGDSEFKLNKSLPAEKQIVTANPDIKSIELNNDDEFLILACDGIWDCMSNQQVVDFVRKQLISEKKLSTICGRVFDKCIAPTSGGEGCDNMTMIIVQFKKPLSSGSSSKEPGS